MGHQPQCSLQQAVTWGRGLNGLWIGSVMKYSRHAAFPLMFAAFLASGCTDGSESIPDEERLLGAWRMVSMETHGKRYDLTAQVQYVFKEETVMIIRPKETSGPHTYELDSTKNPGHLDITINVENVPTAGKRGVPVGGTQKGIYRFQGDTLEICLGRPWKDSRPSEFTSKTTQPVDLMTFKRGTSGEEGKKE